MTESEGHSWDYLLISDIHLGADLVQHARPWTVAQLRQVARIDRDLTGMLRYYRENRTGDRRWRLIIAGDLVDFVGISIAPSDDVQWSTPVSDEERQYGLDDSAERAAYKMRATARRHVAVFEELARFVAEGNALILVRGNHDVSFHWKQAQDAFVEALVSYAPPAVLDFPAAKEEFVGRVEFCPWFYHVEGLLYVEHGHQYDPLCSYPNVFAPVLPGDPTRMSLSLADILMRFVVRPTPGMGVAGHEHRTIFDYVRFAFRLGTVGAARLGMRYVRAVAQLLRQWWLHALDSWRNPIPHEIAHLSNWHEQLRITKERFQDLLRLTTQPVTTSLMSFARVLYLDRLGLVLLAFVATLLSPLWLASYQKNVIYPSLALVLIIVAGIRLAWRRALPDAGVSMQRCAQRIAQLLSVQYVVMGHTHEPRYEKLEVGATYVNLGMWVADDPDSPDIEPTRTHLVLRAVSGDLVAASEGLRAGFYTWDPEHQAPRPYSAAPAALLSPPKAS